jgi:hypothetical protein
MEGVSMLGDVICEETGTVTGTTELSDGKFDVSLTSSGQIRGVDETSEWTYWSETRADGTVYGEGNGVMTTAEGDVINMRGVGGAKSVGEDGSVAYRGAMFFHTDSQEHAALNGGTGVFEYNVDSDGVTKTTVWEWS